jgi:hypothetical protein
VTDFIPCSIPCTCRNGVAYSEVHLPSTQDEGFLVVSLAGGPTFSLDGLVVYSGVEGNQSLVRPQLANHLASGFGSMKL